MSTTNTRLAGRVQGALTGLIVLGALAVAPAAHASTDTRDCALSPNEICNTAAHSLRSVRGSQANSRVVGVGASTNTGESGLYGSWVFGTGYACHSYSGGNVLYALMTNASALSGTFSMSSSWGSDGIVC